MTPEQKTIVITGCSSGFGRRTALHLARHGWAVYATVRKDTDRASLHAEATAQGSAEQLTPVICDITNAEHVAALAQIVAAATPGLNALLNNAGTSFPAPLELLPVADFRAQLEINVVGQLAVTQALLPLIKVARGIIIFVGSDSGRVAFPVTGAYAASKFALEAIGDALRVELAPFGIHVVLLEPGPSPTSIWETSKQWALASWAHGDTGAYASLIAAVENAASRRAAAGFPPQLFAEAVLRILNTPRPRARYPIPRHTAVMIVLRQLMPDGLWDWAVRRMLRW